MENAFLRVLLLLLGGLTLFPATADIFCDNLKQVAATLPRNTASSPEHFATTVFGQAPDVVYALAYCRGDVADDSACGGCVSRVFEILLNSTLPPPPQQQCHKAGHHYGYGDCFVFYSADDILIRSSNNTTGENDALDVAFNGVTWAVMGFGPRQLSLGAGFIHQLLVETVQLAATASTSTSTTPRRFATGFRHRDASFPAGVHSMAQCTPDMSTGNCLACLDHLLGMLNASTMASLPVGAQIHVMRCNLRYETTYRFYNGTPMVYLGAASAPTPTVTLKHKRRMNNFWAIPIIIVVTLSVAAFLCFIFCSRRWLRMHRKGPRRTGDLQGEEELVWQGKSSEFIVFGFEQLLEATNNFSEENKLGRGGFGVVHKGQFPDGLEIAVKRLSSYSGQGFIEFKNEVELIAKLQHRNLVRLLGCCSQEDEKILVYEYLPNRSLDFFIFDENRRALLDWNKRIAIIEGIAHGLLYLHKHSRFLVIHRDLKPSNILLDREMNPKISDFGLAKILTSNSTEESTTRRVVGTYGYMAPEYAYEGLFSIKSDVFSFGVLVLEILGGKRNSANSHECGNFINLLGYAWKLFEEERWGELIDASLDTIGHSEEMMRCLNIALLCVQEKAADRPTMSDVVAMLSNKSVVLVKPKHPAYFNLSSLGKEASTATRPTSINDVTISVTTTGR